MCYSVKTSIFSYTMGMLAAIGALYTRQYALGMLILAYCQIQLAEAIIWSGIDNDNHRLNRLGTAYAKYTLPSHLLFTGIGITLATYYQTGTPNLKPFYMGLVFYIAVCVFYTTRFSIKKDVIDGEKGMSFPSNRSCMKRECQNNENRLQWPFEEDAYYMIQTCLMCVVLYLFLPMKSTIVLGVFFLSTFIISKMLYYWSASTIWCFLSAVLAPMVVVANYYVLSTTSR